MNINRKFLEFAEAEIIQWAADTLDEYREANNKEEFLQETYDEFVQQTFNCDHDHWYSNPRSLTYDDIQNLLTMHAIYCEHQREHADFIVPQPDSIHDLLVNCGYFKATVTSRDRLQEKMVQAFQELDIPQA